MLQIVVTYCMTIAAAAAAGAGAGAYCSVPLSRHAVSSQTGTMVAAAAAAANQRAYQYLPQLQQAAELYVWLQLGGAHTPACMAAMSCCCREKRAKLVATGSALLPACV
jgi:hypothetical protein